MLAARDQENLVYGRQVAGASKPLNQGVTALPPKTPAAKPFKTPYKIPLNDENGAFALGGGKGVVELNGKGNENLKTAGKVGGVLDKNAFVTPLGPRNRAPLGFKTTNAKAKPFQTPAVHVAKDDVGKHKNQNQEASTTARKPKPKVSHSETTKVELLGSKDEVEEREIEYMPPKPKDLPDFPDDFPPDMDYSQLQGANLTRGWFSTYCNPIGEDGLSRFDRQMQESQKKADKEFEEMIERAIEDMPLLGINVPGFPGEETILEAQKRRAAERHQQHQQQKQGQRAKKAVAIDDRKKGDIPRGSQLRRGPPSSASSQAAALLSKQPYDSSSIKARPVLPTSTTIKVPKPKATSRLPSALRAPASKEINAPQPTNPSPMRHAAAAAASRSTLGYAKGRAVSDSLSANSRGRMPTKHRPGASSSSSVAAATQSGRISTDRQRSLMFDNNDHLDSEEDDDDEEDGLLNLKTMGLGMDVLDRDLDAEEDFELPLPVSMT